MTHTSVQPLLDFIAASPSCYHVVSNLAARLTAAGYTPLSERDRWTLTPGGRYFVTRNSSSILAFRVPRKLTGGFMMAAAHSDSPAFKLKENAELRDNGYIRLNTEKYGGMLMATWFDRPLSVAGRLFVRENGAIAEKLVNVDRDLLVIPSVAIHMNRNANDGMKYQANIDTVPLFSAEDPAAAILPLAAEAAGVRPEDVLGQDLFLYCRGCGTVLGAHGEYILSPKLDDLACVWGCTEGFLPAGAVHLRQRGGGLRHQAGRGLHIPAGHPAPHQPVPGPGRGGFPDHPGPQLPGIRRQCPRHPPRSPRIRRPRQLPPHEWRRGHQIQRQPALRHGWPLLCRVPRRLR